MLFPKPISELTSADVENFCARYQEGLRVEYKSTFDTNVRSKIARVVSSFANSYGGVLVIGVNAQNGIPQPPFEGIEFTDREPRLTVENICRDRIFPEVLIYQQLVPSRVQGKAFLLIQVNESPKAPHAIENSTQVYVRTGDSANPTELADMQLLEHQILRRRDVLQRWETFFSESQSLAGTVGVGISTPHLEMRVGPLYPTDTLIAREKISAFLNDYNVRSPLGFQELAIRHPTGAFLVRGDSAKYLNIGEIGTLHYLERLRFMKEPRSGRTITNIWWLQKPLQAITSTTSVLLKDHGVTCDIRIESRLKSISGSAFYLSNADVFEPIISSPPFQVIPASLTYSSERLEKSAESLIVELLYQLRWPLGEGGPQTRKEIAAVVNRR